jgi:hypothetical protein
MGEEIGGSEVARNRTVVNVAHRVWVKRSARCIEQRADLPLG